MLLHNLFPSGLLLFFSISACFAQVVADVRAVPDTGKPPVIFLNGYQSGCNEPVTFAGTFGQADRLLTQTGRSVLFFNNCNVPGNPPIEELGNAFALFLNSLRFTGGREVPQVDVVAHSMGGLIVRSYLAGKQPERGVFHPPVNPRIRKAVFIATPFFGAAVAERAPSPDAQTLQLLPGSPFLFDLATWNQGMDDMRGIDAVAIAASGGNGLISGIPRFDDSTVTLTSASLEFLQSGRTRIVPMCHTSGIAAFACVPGSPAVAQMNNEQHAAAAIMLSFLEGTEAWKSVGEAPSANVNLASKGGLILQIRNDQDQILPISAIEAPAGTTVRVRSGEIAWAADLAPAQQFLIRAATPAGTLPANVPVSAGFTTAFAFSTARPGIAGIFPSFSAVSPRSVAPGSFLSIYGVNLATSTGVASSQPYPTSLGGVSVTLGTSPLGLQYASPTQINALVPVEAEGLQRLTVRTPSGLRAVNLLIEPAVPSIFPTAVHATTGALVTPASPIRRGEFLSLYLTGLGRTERGSDGLERALLQPAVTVGGAPCELQYAGRAPGFAGLDQINCRVGDAAQTGAQVEVRVVSGSRSAVISVPVQ